MSTSPKSNTEASAMKIIRGNGNRIQTDFVLGMQTATPLAFSFEQFFIFVFSIFDGLSILTSWIQKYQIQEKDGDDFMFEQLSQSVRLLHIRKCKSYIDIRRGKAAVIPSLRYAPTVILIFQFTCNPYIEIRFGKKVQNDMLDLLTTRNIELLLDFNKFISYL